jgi:hypothetical protein
MCVDRDELWGNVGAITPTKPVAAEITITSSDKVCANSAVASESMAYKFNGGFHDVELL